MLTLADQFQNDVANVLLTLNDFGEQITYRPAGNSELEFVITALVQRGPLLVRGVDMGNTARWELSVWMKKSDVQEMTVRGDVLMIPPKRGDEPKPYTPAIDLTPPHVPHMVRWGLIARRT